MVRWLQVPGRMLGAEDSGMARQAFPCPPVAPRAVSHNHSAVLCYEVGKTRGETPNPFSGLREEGFQEEGAWRVSRS